MSNTAQNNFQDSKIKKIWKFFNSPFPAAVLASLISFMFSSLYTYRVKNNFQQQISLKQEQVQSVNLPLSIDNNSTLGLSDEHKGNDATNSFNPEDWIFVSGMISNKEGYYCPARPPFPSWAMWTKKKYRAEREISITFSLKDNTDNDKNPTLFISYGDKTNEAPDAFYRFNIFDGDLNTLRLLGRDEERLQTATKIDKAHSESFIVFTISPVFINKKSSTLMLNPTISAKDYEFNPKEEFKIELPFPSIENQGDGFQYGLGVSKGDCFKILSSSL